METFTRELLDRAKSLVGSTLVDVRSCRRVDDVSGAWIHASEVAQTGSGIVLKTDRTAIAVVSSDALTDGTYELSLIAGPHIDREVVVDVASLRDQPAWQALIGHTIVKSKIHWVDSPFVMVAKRRKAFSSHHFDVDGAIPFAGPKAPLALELHDDVGGRVLLVSGSWTGSDEPIGETGAGLCVLWDASTFATLVPRIAKDLRRSW